MPTNKKIKHTHQTLANMNTRMDSLEQVKSILAFAHT